MPPTDYSRVNRFVQPGSAVTVIKQIQREYVKLAISEFPKWSKYLILLSFQDNSSARSVQIGGWM